MSNGAQVDYTALAKQYGGTPQQDSGPDYTALAAQYGGAPASMPAPNQTGMANQELARLGINKTVAPPSNAAVTPQSNAGDFLSSATMEVGKHIPSLEDRYNARAIKKNPNGKGYSIDPNSPELNPMPDNALANGGPLGGVADAIGARDYSRAAGEAAVAVPTTIQMATGAVRATGIGKPEGAVGRVENTPSYVERVTNTTPERLAELKSFPEKAKAVRQTVVDAEKSAHQAASDAFPQFDKPIELKPAVPGTDTGAIDSAGNPIRTAGKPAETTTWRDLQEKRSDLLQKIADEKVAVSRGQASRFDLADMYEKLQGIDTVMNKAALDQGGPEGLAKLEQARTQFRQYMDDFHNKKSPLRAVLEMAPDEQAKIVNHFTNADKGARALETLRRNGVDTSGIVDLLSKGERPLKVTAAESDKLIKAGSDKNYKIQRINESISQTKKNELPGTAQERLPASELRNRWPSIIGEIPGVNTISPRRVTQFRLERGLSKLGGPEPVPSNATKPPQSGGFVPSPTPTLPSVSGGSGPAPTSIGPAARDAGLVSNAESILGRMRDVSGKMSALAGEPQIEQVEPTGQSPVGSGTAATSNEEVARNEKFYKVGRGDSLTFMGKQPDASLKAGEAVVGVKPDGSTRIVNQNGAVDQAAVNRKIAAATGRGGVHPPETMGGASINKEITAIDQRMSKINDEMIQAGRGNERYSDIMQKSDPLSQRYKALSGRRDALMSEAKARYGPDWRPGYKLSGPIKGRK